MKNHPQRQLKWHESPLIHSPYRADCVIAYKWYYIISQIKFAVIFSAELLSKCLLISPILLPFNLRRIAKWIFFPKVRRKLVIEKRFMVKL